MNLPRDGEKINHGKNDFTKKCVGLHGNKLCILHVTKKMPWYIK